MKNIFKELFRPDLKHIDDSLRSRELIALLKEVNVLMEKPAAGVEDTVSAIASSIMRLMKITKCAVFYRDNIKEQYDVIFSFGIDKGELSSFMTGKKEMFPLLDSRKAVLFSAARQNEPHFPEELFSAFNLQSALFEPLINEDGMHYCLFSADKTGSSEFDKHDLSVYELMIPFYKLILQNTLIRQKDIRRVKALENLREVDRMLLLDLEPRRVLDLIVKKLAEIFEADSAGVLIYNESAVALNLYSSYGLSDRYKDGLSIPLGKGVTGLCAKERHSIRVNDVSKDARYLSVEGSQTGAELAAPLMISDRLIGVLNVESMKKNKFSADDETLLVDFSLSAALILKGALGLK